MNSELAVKYNVIYDNVSMRDVISLYTTSKVTKEVGRCECPLHNGRDINFSYNRIKYQCFVCGARGNVISFVAHYFGSTNVEAAKKISNDFGLGVFDNGYKVRKSESRYIRKRQQSEEKASERLEELNEEYRKQTDLLHAVNEAIKRMSPTSEEEITDELARLVHFRSNLEYKIEKIYQEITKC